MTDRGRPARRCRFVVPGDVQAPTGGNRYDLRLAAGLSTLGWTVDVVEVPGGWPQPGAAALGRLCAALRDRAPGSVVLVDGLVGCAAPQVLAGVRPLAVLVHLPLADETGLAPQVAAVLRRAEERALTAADRVVVTSEWAAARLGKMHPALVPTRVVVAAPGTDPAPPATARPDGQALLCVASLTPRKDQLGLVQALHGVRDLRWRCELVGPASPLSGYPAQVRGTARRLDLGDRVLLLGPLSGPDLERAYRRAGLLVLVSRVETYGMVVSEALARGVPALVSSSGALPQTLGRAPDGTVPGLLVPPGEPALLAATLRRWLTDAALRARLWDAAAARAGTLPGWERTAATVDRVLDGLVPDGLREGRG